MTIQLYMCLNERGTSILIRSPARNRGQNTGKDLEGIRKQKKNEPFFEVALLIFPGEGGVPGKLGISMTLLPAKQPCPTPQG